MSWDERVRAHSRASYLQTTAWAQVKAPNGWRPTLLADAEIGGQVLIQALPVVPWHFAYVPRGPLAAPWTAATVDAWTELVRGAGRRGSALEGVGLLRMDPEVEVGVDDGPSIPPSAPTEGAAVVERLEERGWRRARDVQPHATRIIDLSADEAALWSDLRKKWRQYVNKARSNGIVVREVDPAVEPAAFETFHRVMTATAARAHVPIRTAAAYRDLWAAFASSGECELRFAEDATGQPLAVLLTVRCGGRVVEPYGGMTDEGGELRANYLLKWEAIRRSRESGAISYDMWGLVHPGIAQFKEGFGGREVRYIGAWDLALDPVAAAAIRAGEATRRLVAPIVRARRRGAVVEAD